MRLIFHKHTFENQNVWSFLLFFSVTGFDSINIRLRIKTFGLFCCFSL